MTDEQIALWGEGYDTGVHDARSMQAAQHREWSERDDREKALHLAVAYCESQEMVSPEGVVKYATAFGAYLRGEGSS